MSLQEGQVMHVCLSMLPAKLAHKLQRKTFPWHYTSSSQVLYKMLHVMLLLYRPCY